MPAQEGEQEQSLKVFSAICNVIYEKPLHHLGHGDNAVDISSSGTAERYRLVDCKALVDEKILRICEYSTFPDVAYCAISYVWRNVRNENSFVDKDCGIQFSVKGAESADPINTDVLHHACTASLLRCCTHLWLDRLCIMQTCKQDKQWQIKEMHHMYQACNVCVVLAGGLQYMVSLEDETSWIHRGWTLQEALAPPTVEVLFAWKLGSGAARAGTDSFGRVEEVVPNQSAVTSISLLLKTCTTGVMSFTQDGQSKTLMVEAKLFSSYPLQHTYHDIPFWRPTRKILPPNVAALCVAMESDMDEDTKQYAIWQSALMRTSSRPVDMVLSIMGLFGVSLNPKDFKADDRLRATIALARAILTKGGRATWLGASFKLPPCKQLSTFPVFPQTRVAGKALVKVSEGTREVSELMDNEYHYSGPLVPFPHGNMDDDGYFTFVAKAVRVEPATSALVTEKIIDPSMPTTLKARDGSVWQVCSSITDPHVKTPVFAVLLGWYNAYYPGQTPSHDADNIRTLLIIEHAPGKSYVRSYISLSIKCRRWVMSWEEHQLCIGPETTVGQPCVDDGSEELVEASAPDLQLLRSAPNFQMSPHPTLMDLAARQARWAVPQHTLEKHTHR